MATETTRELADRLFKQYQALLDRPGTPSELIEEAHDLWCDAEHNAWLDEGN